MRSLFINVVVGSTILISGIGCYSNTDNSLSFYANSGSIIGIEECQVGQWSCWKKEFDTLGCCGPDMGGNNDYIYC